jgi:branched-chain amino acid aminotransferase
VLDGITRNTIIALARDKGIPIAESQISRDELYIADEVFMTGTAAEVTPVREIDRRQIGAGSRGPITKTLQAAFFDVVTGRDRKYEGWLSFV